MARAIILIPFLVFIQFVSAQQVKFTEGQYLNGLTYPIVSLGASPDAQATMNENILSIVSIYESMDYCISQYGYVQQTNYIQLHFYFNCIDMDESKNEYHLFDMKSGEPCKTSAMFLDNQMKKFKTYLNKKVMSYYVTIGETPPFLDDLENHSIDDFTALLTQDGISLRSTTLENWGDGDLKLSWKEIQPYLKTTFL